MAQQSLGLIETVGLAAAIVAADAAAKSANVTVVGYELTKGDGMATIKVLGGVGAVTAAIDAATVAAGKVGRVVSTRVIARPAAALEGLIHSRETVGITHATPAAPSLQTPPPPPAPVQEEHQPEPAQPMQVQPEQPAPEQAPSEQASPDKSKPVDESELKADDEPLEAEQDTAQISDSEKADSPKKRKKKK